MDTLSSWDQQDPDSQYAKRRRLMEGGAQLPTSPQVRYTGVFVPHMSM
jgi:hypothetical protein